VNHHVVNSELPLGTLDAERGAHDVASAQRLAPSRGHSTASHSAAAPQRNVALLSRAGALLGTVGVALLPKCPACWSVYAGLSGWLGLSIALDQALLLPLTLVCLALTLLVLANGARRSRRSAPLACAALAAVGVYLGKFSLDSPVLAHASLCVLVLAALLGRRAESCSKLAQHA
jgi:hypothetical protein